MEIGLTSIFGIGRTRSNKILEKAQVDRNIRIKDLSEDEVRKIRQIIQDEGRVEGDLRRDVGMDIKRLMEIGCYRGIVIAVAFRSAGRGRTRMLVPARGPARVLLPARKKRARSSN